jgi:hypothetical protein
LCGKGTVDRLVGNREVLAEILRFMLFRLRRKSVTLYSFDFVKKNTAKDILSILRLHGAQAERKGNLVVMTNKGLNDYMKGTCPPYRTGATRVSKIVNKEGQDFKFESEKCNSYVANGFVVSNDRI